MMAQSSRSRKAALFQPSGPCGRRSIELRPCCWSLTEKHCPLGQVFQVRTLTYASSPPSMICRPKHEMRENDASCVEITHASQGGGDGPGGFQAVFRLIDRWHCLCVQSATTSPARKGPCEALCPLRRDGQRLGACYFGFALPQSAAAIGGTHPMAVGPTLPEGDHRGGSVGARAGQEIAAIGDHQPSAIGDDGRG